MQHVGNLNPGSSTRAVLRTAGNLNTGSGTRAVPRAAGNLNSGVQKKGSVGTGEVCEHCFNPVTNGAVIQMTCGMWQKWGGEVGGQGGARSRAVMPAILTFDHRFLWKA